MCEITRRAVMAIMAADDTATDVERDKVARAVAGDYPPLTVCAAAERLGVSRPTLYAMIRAGRLRRLPDGRVCGSSVADYLASRTKEVA